MRNNLSELYNDPKIYRTAFDAITAGYDTHTATGPGVPLAELDRTEGHLAQFARNIATLLLSDSAPADRNPLTIDLAIRYASRSLDISEEQTDAAVRQELFTQTSDRMSL